MSGWLLGGRLDQLLGSQRGAGAPPHAEQEHTAAPAPDEDEAERAERGEGLALATPMKKLMVGEMNCRKPMTDSGIRRAAQENSTSGTAVMGPEAISQIAVAGSPKWPAPLPLQPGDVAERHDADDQGLDQETGLGGRPPPVCARCRRSRS